MPITNEQANLIYEIVTVYENSFSGLRYDYTYKERVNGSSPLNKSMSILWKSENFMHLCGIARYEKIYIYQLITPLPILNNFILML